MGFYVALQQWAGARERPFSAAEPSDLVQRLWEAQSASRGQVRVSAKNAGRATPNACTRRIHCDGTRSMQISQSVVRLGGCRRLKVRTIPYRLCLAAALHSMREGTKFLFYHRTRGATCRPDTLLWASSSAGITFFPLAPFIPLLPPSPHPSFRRLFVRYCAAGGLQFASSAEDQGIFRSSCDVDVYSVGLPKCHAPFWSTSARSRFRPCRPSATKLDRHRHPQGLSWRRLSVLLLAPYDCAVWLTANAFPLVQPLQSSSSPSTTSLQDISYFTFMMVSISYLNWARLSCS